MALPRFFPQQDHAASPRPAPGDIPHPAPNALRPIPFSAGTVVFKPPLGGWLSAPQRLSRPHSAAGHLCPPPHTSLPRQPGRTCTAELYFSSFSPMVVLLPGILRLALVKKRGRVEHSLRRISWDSARGPGGLHWAGEDPVQAGTPPASICQVNQGSSFPPGDGDLWVSPSY